MKKNIINILSTGVVLVSSILFSSCGPDFLDTTPSNRVSTNEAFTSANKANAVVNGAYERFYYEFIGSEARAWDQFTEIMDLDVNWVSGNAPLLLGSATASSHQFAYWWKAFYEEIYRTSNVIQNIDQVPDMSDNIKARNKAECHFLRAWAYYRANCLYRGVPIYTEPVEYGKATKARSTEEEVWKQVIDDCTAAINEPNLPNKYVISSSDYGRVTKAAAYYLRGQVYLWQKEWAKASADFKIITTMGYELFGDYKAMFKAANEKNNEYIFQYQYTDDDKLGNYFSQCYGNRVTVNNAWNNYLPNPMLIDSYEWANGKPFNIDEMIPGYSSMEPKARSVFYLRDSLNVNATGTKLDKAYKAGYNQMVTYGSDMTKYLEYGNEARIKAIYEGRDPRLLMNIITPYSEYKGGCTPDCFTYTLRWPYFGADAEYPYDLRTDTNDRYYYLWRKFVIEGRESRTIWDSDIDIPIFRYAGALLSLAEALNEEGKTTEAIKYVNQVRARIPGLALLNSNSWTTVTGQDNMRERIRKEMLWELAGENQMYWKELRWGTWADKKFGTNRLTESDHTKYNGANGMTEIWGTKRYTLNYNGDYEFKWAIPLSEIERNPNLKQNDGWK